MILKIHEYCEIFLHQKLKSLNRRKLPYNRYLSLPLTIRIVKQRKFYRNLFVLVWCPKSFLNEIFLFLSNAWTSPSDLHAHYFLCRALIGNRSMLTLKFFQKYNFMFSTNYLKILISSYLIWKQRPFKHFEYSYCLDIHFLTQYLTKILSKF